MSGGWHRSFTLGVPTAVTLSFRYRLTETAEYEADEFSQMLVSVDGVLHGISPNDYIAQVVGGGPHDHGMAARSDQPGDARGRHAHRGARRIQQPEDVSRRERRGPHRRRGRHRLDAGAAEHHDPTGEPDRDGTKRRRLLCRRERCGAPELSVAAQRRADQRRHGVQLHAEPHRGV